MQVASGFRCGSEQSFIDLFCWLYQGMASAVPNLGTNRLGFSPWSFEGGKAQSAFRLMARLKPCPEYKLFWATGQLKSQRTLVVHVVIADRTILISQIENSGDDDSNAKADCEEDPIRRKGNQNHEHDCSGNDKASRALYVDGHLGEHLWEILVPREDGR
jgi:hypothetical protein